MSKPKKPSAPIGGTIILVIFIVMVLIVVLAFVDIEPFSSLTNGLRQWVQSAPEQVQKLVAGSQTTLTTAASNTAPAQEVFTVQTQTISNWEYTLKSMKWSGNTATLDMSIRNIGGQSVPFGFSYPVSDESFTKVYKLCAQNSGKQIFWDSSIDSTGTGFYSKYFSPGETMSGTLRFKITPYSEKIYLCLSNGGNVANKLFYLGNPQP